MGCAIFPEERATVEPKGKRNSKRTQLIDTRQKSTQAIDILLESITVLSEKLNTKEQEFATAVLRNHNLFTAENENQLVEIAANMGTATAEPDKQIFQEGDKGACFFIIEEGEIEIILEPSVKKVLRGGDSFGELALIYTSKRTATAKNVTPPNKKLKLLFIKSKPFKSVMKGIRQKNNERTKLLVERVEIFSLLTTKQKFAILSNLIREFHKAGTVIFKKGQIPTSFYIIETGAVSIAFEDTAKKDLVLKELESFGESVFRKKGRREGTAVVLQDLTCLTISQEKMKQILGGNLGNIVFHNLKKWALGCSPLFHEFENHQLDKIASQFQTKVAKAGEVIHKSGKAAEKIIINLEGRMNNLPIGTLFNDEYFDLTEKLEKQIVKNDRGVYAQLGMKRLKEIMEIIKKRGIGALSEKKRMSLLSTKENQEAISFDSLDYLMKLGQGQFGMVYLVKQRKSGQLFALKCLDKAKIKEENMEESAVYERDILSSIAHPLIVGFYRAYEDSRNVYFLLEYILGIQMFQAIRQIGILNKTMARYYFGSILVAIEYLHSKSIIYRDIKPENSIINYVGKVFLIDLGTAKQLKSDNCFRTDTIIGTPHYMAPEVMQGKGYSLSVDVWSLGILFYELICGHLPFAESIENPYAVYSEILRCPLQFPSFLNDQSAKSIIRKMLNKSKPEARMSEQEGFQWIRDSTYFDGFKWEDLEEGKMVAPYVPRKFRNSKTYKYESQGMPLVQFLNQKRRSSEKQNSKQSHLEIREWLTHTIK